MHGLTLDAVGSISYRTDLPDPQLIEPSDAVIAVAAAGLCGSDLHPYEGRERVRFGVVPGHEAVGHVVEAGAASQLEPGTRVLASFTTSCGRCQSCRSGLTARCDHGQLLGYGSPDDDAPPVHGAQAQLLRLPLADTTAVEVPPAIGDTEAILLTDNLPTAWYAVRRADIATGGSVLIVGLGAVGLCAVVAALAVGAGSVIAADPVADRRRRAELLGATAVDPEAAAHAGKFSSVIEAAGTPSAQHLAFNCLAAGGTLSVIAVQTAATFGFTPVAAYDRNATVRFGRAPVRSVLDEILPLLADGVLRSPANEIVTHPNVALAEGPAVYRRFAHREEGLVKAVFRPNPQMSTD